MPLLAEATAMEPKKCVGVMLLRCLVGVSVGVFRLGYEGPRKASEPPLLVIIVLLKQCSNPCLCLSNILEELSIDTEAIE